MNATIQSDMCVVPYGLFQHVDRTLYCCHSTTDPYRDYTVSCDGIVGSVKKFHRYGTTGIHAYHTSSQITTTSTMTKKVDGPSAMHIHHKSCPSGLHTRYPNKFMVERFVKGGVIYIIYRLLSIGPAATSIHS